MPGALHGSKGTAPHCHRAFGLTGRKGGFLPLKGLGSSAQLAPGHPSITPHPHLAQARVPAPAAMPAAGAHSHILLHHGSLIPWVSLWQLFSPGFNAFLPPSPPSRAPQIPFSSHQAFPKQNRVQLRVSRLGAGDAGSAAPILLQPPPPWKQEPSRPPQLLCQHQTGTPCSAGR